MKNIYFILLGLNLILLMVLIYRTKKQSQIIKKNKARMAELTEVARGVSHEINNPLAIIQGSVETLLRQIKSPQINQQVVERMSGNISRTIKRISKIAQALKLFAYDGSRQPLESINIKNIIDEAVITCDKKIAEIGIDLKVNVVDPDLKVDGHQKEFIQMISNLISNSCDAIKGLDLRTIEIEARVFADEVEISVTDSGQGIAKESLDKIMKPFFTTKPAGEGTGLGLSIVQGIVSSHSGKVFIDTESPKTRFVLRLPMKIAA